VLKFQKTLYALGPCHAVGGAPRASAKGSANIDLHLPQRKPVSLRLQVGTRQPIEWVEQVTNGIIATVCSTWGGICFS
jgi:hypothetical protein